MMGSEPIGSPGRCKRNGDTMRDLRSKSPLLAVLVALALIAAACSGGSNPLSGIGSSDGDGDEAATGSATDTGDGADGADPGLPATSGGAGGDGGGVAPDLQRNPAPDLVPSGLDPAIDDARPWSDPATWPDGRVPGAGDTVTIAADQAVVLDQDAELAGLTVDGQLYFSPSASVTLASNANIVVNGLLYAKPASADVQHVIRFFGFDGSGHVGGGMQPVDSDVGLWVTDSGQAFLEGSPRRGWTNLTAGVGAGETTVTVEDAAGWQVGDRVVLTPTAPPGEDFVLEEGLTTGFHDTTIAAIDGTTITLADPTTAAHPIVAGLYTAELANLTRNVTIHGTPEGGGHVFIHSHDHPQFMRWVGLEDLGVAEALGRYPLHIHHAGMGSYGSLFEGVVSVGGRHHAFVPHESHGITMRDMVAYDTTGGDVVWWDEGDETSDLLLDRVLVAGSDHSSFYLGRGTNMIVRDSVGVGVENLYNDGAFEWENGAVGNWLVENVVAHNNNSSGIRVWQNSNIPQIVDGYVAYHNWGAAIDHGAYSNRYVYRNGHYYGNREAGVILLATSDPTPIALEQTVIDTGGISEGAHVVMAHSAVPAYQPTVFRDVEFIGSTDFALFDFFTEGAIHQVQCIDCRWPEGAQVVEFHGSNEAETWLEVIGAGGSVRYESDGNVAEIETPPAAYLSGGGVGLTAEYFHGPDLTDLAFTTIMPGLTEEWEINPDAPAFGVMPAHHLISVQDGSSARLSGQLEIAEGAGGAYRFGSVFGGGLRLWINGQLLIDDWDNVNLNGGFDDPYSTGYNIAELDLAPGRHDIVVELRDSLTEGGWRSWFFSLMWDVPGGEAYFEIIQANQLHPTTIPDNSPTPALS